MKLSDLSPLMARSEDGGLSYDRFCADLALASPLLEAGTTVAATMGVQMAEQALGALVQ